MDIRMLISNLSQKRPVFHNEADFQHALAWEIREWYPNSKIRLEMKVHGANTKTYLDIWVQHADCKYAIELKYKTRSFNCNIEDEHFSLNNHGAHDIGRYDVLKDLQRLEQMVTAGVVDQGFLIFITNDPAYYSEQRQGQQTVDRDFRLHEGRSIEGHLSWSENTGIGTMRGREEPISLQGHYKIKWDSYTRVDLRPGEFNYLLLPVDNFSKDEKHSQHNSESFITPAANTDMAVKLESSETEELGDWFQSFAMKKDIPISQMDLRDRIVSHLRQVGYITKTNRELGTEKIDIWAEKGSKTIIIEVRYKTALLQTVYLGKQVDLKNQAAQDVSRYDFLKDLEKVERVVSSRPSVKGYALLITNDHLYWQHPKKTNSVDGDFHIYNGRKVTGICSWKEGASNGTTSGREAAIHLTDHYQLKWQLYLELGMKKNEQFQALLVEVNGDNS
ncbi:hypothetical protein ACFPYJ_05600 [Paenibacillus solisilvae]|uniref:Uncharacterized protein n=1 Tax=Paenibacillus solisilvae TaxID=2486751 RepID=A0ABW0VT26_9BACL